ncbi:Adenylate cyclase [Diplonema papillatum]|nr:Adenylate cyclase [Diplonema papillatum]
MAAVEDKAMRKGLSLQLLFPLLMLFAVVCSVTVNIAMMTWSFDDALTRTETTGSAALNVSYLMAEAILQDNIVSLHGASGAVLGGLVSQEVQIFEIMVTSYGRYIADHYKFVGQPKDSLQWLLETSFEMSNMITTIDQSRDDASFTASVDAELYVVMFGRANSLSLALNSDGGASDTVVYAVKEDLLVENAKTVTNISKEWSSDPITLLAARGYLEPGEQVWIKPLIFSDYGWYCAGVYLDPVSQASTTYRLELGPTMFQHVAGYLVEYVSSSNSVSNENAVRAFGVQAVSPVLSEFPFNDPLRNKFNSIDTISFTSVGEPHYPINDTHFQFYRDTEHPDPVVKTVATFIHTFPLAYSDVAKLSSSSIVANIGDLGKYLIEVNRMGALEGFVQWVVIAVEYDTLIAGFDKDAEENAKMLEQEQRKVSDDVDANIVVVTVITIAVTLLILVGVTTVSWFIVLPIKKLQEDMSYVADMDLNRPAERLSILQEVRSMQVSFQSMVRNLKEFKAYVPQAVLKNRSSDNVESEVAIAKPPTGLVAFVFTDIDGSTALWEKSPADMDVALEIHNEIMREAARKHGGYEVKTIGDSFMLAFRDPTSALKFAFRAQKGLLEKKWPVDLEIAVYKDRNGKPKSGGMPVRMGAHFGAAMLEQNPITGRSDYRGGVVNMASRVEGKAKAGTLCVSADFYNAVSAALSSNDEDASGVAADFGEHELKGLGLHVLYSLAPTCFKERLSHENYYRVEMQGSSSVQRTNSESDSKHSSRESRVVGPELGPVNKTGLFLHQVEATVAVCRVLDQKDGKFFEACNQVIRCGGDAATLTDGAVLILCGNNLLLAWNTAKTCRMHATAALQFAAELRRLCRPAIVNVGVATGLVHYGNVGTVSKRFSTVAGRTVTVAMLASELCSRYRTFSLVGDFTTTNNLTTKANVSALVRMVDVWKDIVTGKKVLLYQLVTSKLKQLESIWEALDDTDNLRHDALLRESLAGNTDALEKLRLSAADDDKVMKLVLLNLHSMSVPNPQFRVLVDLDCPSVPPELTLSDEKGVKS